MKKNVGIFFFAFLLGCRATTPVADSRMVVATSIAPLADFVRQVGGDRVRVFSIVPSGANPHTFELSPDQMSQLAFARVIFLNGIGLEYWANNILDNFGSRGLQVVQVSNGIPILADQDHAGGNPHVWLNPQYAIKQVASIRDALCRLDSASAPYYNQNAERYLQQLKKLDDEIEQEIKTWQFRSFICFHPSWNYFADRYGLIQAAVIEKRPGFEPTPGEVAEIITLAKKLKAKAIFAEKQFPLKVSQMIAQEAGAAVLVLDPLGEDSASYRFVQLLKSNVDLMAEALR
jgi:manganese/iron transport system substrate-binding protein